MTVLHYYGVVVVCVVMPVGGVAPVGGVMPAAGLTPVGGVMPFAGLNVPAALAVTVACVVVVCGCVCVVAAFATVTLAAVSAIPLAKNRSVFFIFVSLRKLNNVVPLTTINLTSGQFPNMDVCHRISRRIFDNSNIVI